MVLKEKLSYNLPIRRAHVFARSPGDGQLNRYSSAKVVAGADKQTVSEGL